MEGRYKSSANPPALPCCTDTDVGLLTTLDCSTVPDRDIAVESSTPDIRHFTPETIRACKEEQCPMPHAMVPDELERVADRRIVSTRTLGCCRLHNLAV
ncbi:uncharacterized protein PHACADRAFT_266225 [Phanerochaete carnosa HHB-10118-sp]|uniref:Uncharacterized protein n=1 Tax=Phanerochaete carnosa (strain HHB-10118-sp) TaxID=650164 RepID=K5VPY7_PHACS|nr:uncharacterized protein PHACADRAFT_266225 [Phanerochaete carnosa HHB-10118-sp]EKM48654.1 hypothetical protein PHACADRAFT_266225 [Phanerochaete carnosa HHB-10118-sp]